MNPSIFPLIPNQSSQAPNISDIFKQDDKHKKLS